MLSFIRLAAKAGVLLTALSCGIGASVHAQTVPPKFDHITTEHGLSHHLVYTLAQTPDGAIWIGTYHGLNRYDGYSVKSFTTQLYDDPAIPLKVVNRILADTKGNLWIVSRNRFLKYNLASRQFLVIQHDTSGKFNEAAFYYRGLAIDSTGNVWLGAIDRLQRFNPADSSFVTLTVDSAATGALHSSHILDITVDRSGRVWVLVLVRVEGGDVGELYRFDEATNTFERFPISYRSREFAERALLADSRGKIWIAGSPDGVIEFDPTTNASVVHKTPMRNGTSHTISVFEDKRSRIWIGGWAGLHIFDPATQQLASYYEDKTDPFALQIDMISAVYEDQSGNMWLGIWGGGVDVLKARRKQFGHFKVAEKPDEKSEWVTAIYADKKNTLWFGTGRGLFAFDWKTKSFRRFTFYPADKTIRYGKNHVQDIVERDDGKLWVSTFQGGLVLLDPRSGDSKLFLHNPNNPASLSENVLQHVMIDNDDDLWVATRTRGLNLLKKGSNAFIRFQNRKDDSTSVSTNRIWRAYQDRSGKIWVMMEGPGSSLSLVDKASGKFTRVLFDKQNPESHAFPFRHVQEDTDGTFWLAGQDNGLFHFNPANGSFERFTEREGLPFPYTGGILHDGKNRIWFVSPKGLSRFSIAEKTFETFEYGADIAERSYSNGAAFRTSDGYMYFGGRNGVTYFHPDSVQTNDVPPETRIVDVQVFGTSLNFPTHISQLDHIEIRHDQNYLSFEFVGMDFTDPPKNQFRYMMAGFDEGWIHAGARRYASYTHLDPGTYTFKVKSANNDGVWGKEVSLGVIVKPAWWQTWWFRFLAFVAVAGILYAAYRYRLNRMLEVERTRATIATDLHDDIGTTLTSIALFSDLAKQDMRENPSLAAERLDKIVGSSRVLLDQMNDIVWSVKPQNDSLENAILRMTDVARTLFDVKGIEHTITLPQLIDDVKLSMQQRRNILLIFKEMINNVVKHSKATMVTIEVADGAIEKGMTGVRVSVKDNGKGFDTSVAAKGNGLKNMQSRAASIGGTVTIRSTLGEGTHAELAVPYE